MSRNMRSSRTLRHAEKRSTAIGSLGPSVDLGNGLTLEKYEVAISDTRSKLESVNEILARARVAENALLETEKTLRDLSTRMLAGIAAKFGKDSVEYSNAGGVRTSDRKRRVSKKPVVV
ncbi:MAG: hypothetical protein HY720_07385 [Planctomycetes bacterium]|nr:hypothetical protein [Planctomycetota bacterium]